MDEQRATGAVLSLEEEAQRLLKGNRATAPQAREHKCTEVVLQRGDTITPEPIRWLWREWLAAGKLHVLAGSPGTGKTTAAMAVAATVTIGGRWPDGTHAPKGRVVIWSGEDDPKDTLAPRLIASGADMSCVAFVTGARDGSERKPFDPATDMPALRDAIQKAGGAQLLIVDPVVSAVSGDGHKANDVRRGLQPLADLAATTGCAVIGITHLTKGTQGREPTERITGSLSYGAFARVVWLAAKQSQDDAQGGGDRVLCRSKSNIGADDGGFAYSLDRVELERYPGVFGQRVLWGEAIEGSAREILAQAEAQPSGGEGGKLHDAVQWLRDALENGHQTTKTIEAMAKDAGIGTRTLRRAREYLKVITKPEGFRGAHIWFLPAQENECTPTLDQENAHLTTKNDGQLCNNLVKSGETGSSYVREEI